MSKSVIQSGICGFTTEVIARADGSNCSLMITSHCPEIRKLAEELRHVNPMEEITYRGEGPLTLRVAKKHCPHPACPVPSGIIKAVEVEAGLALPKDATITVMRTNGE
jgi:hypothetical protein